MELNEHCIGFDRVKDNISEQKTMDWLNKSHIAIPHTNLQAIKDLVLCMDISSPNYSHLSESEKEKVQDLIKHEREVNTVLVTLFRWFGSHVGEYCLKTIRAETQTQADKK